MTSWRVAVEKLHASMSREPGSKYVSLYLTRSQAEALLRKLEKPHLFPEVRS